MRFAVLHHLESAGDGPAAAVYAEVAEQVRVAEELDFAIAWVAEHHFSAARGWAPAPLLLLTHLAAQTHRIGVGSAVLPAPFYHPVRLAEGVAMADLLSGGRLACGISSSGVPDEMRVFGVAQEGKHEQLRATLLWLRRAWAGETVELPEAVRPAAAPAVRIEPLPQQRPEDLLWVAASSNGAAGVAGELGLHLLLPSLRPLEASAAHVTTYRTALARAGVAAGTRKVQCTMHLVLHEEHDTAMRLAEPILRAYYERYVRQGAVARLEDESLPAIMRRINFAAGGPEAVAEQIARLAGALGLTHIAFQARLIGLTHRQVLHGLELAMTRVAPLVSALVGAES